MLSKSALPGTLRSQALPPRKFTYLLDVHCPEPCLSRDGAIRKSKYIHTYLYVYLQKKYYRLPDLLLLLFKKSVMKTSANGRILQSLNAKAGIISILNFYHG